MKFARYLEDTQAPEWKRAYIDYRSLKKQIRCIKLEQGGILEPVMEISHDFNQDSGTESTELDKSFGKPDAGALAGTGTYSMDSTLSQTVTFVNSSSTNEKVAVIPPSGFGRRNSKQVDLPSLSSRPTSYGVLRSPRSSFQFFLSDRGSAVAPTLHQLFQHLCPAQRKFFRLLDANLNKVESFYIEREKEMSERSSRLQEQLEQLGAHHQQIYGTPPSRNSMLSVRKGLFTGIQQRKSTDLRAAAFASEARGEETLQKQFRLGYPSNSVEKQIPGTTKATFDPREYRHAKKKLKKAVTEHYRGLEMLNNYRILNLLGFRKALKKFEKVTKLPAVSIYMCEKVEPCAFASAVLVNNMLKQMEESYAERFTRGDRRIATKRLRSDTSATSHHMSSFRSGIYIGFALAATATGIYQCSQSSTRDSLHAWNILLFTYSIFLMPVLMLLLVGLNINVWARERINYAFIFELDLKSRMDPRKYFEIPSLISCGLACAFRLSFSSLGSPMLWPLIWLVFVVLVLFNPIPHFMSGSSRWWMIKNIAKLTLSGTFMVNFTAFWLGDQLCSLGFTFENLYFFSCLYSNYFPSIPGDLAKRSIFSKLSSSAYDYRIQDAWQTCSGSRNWGLRASLASLPYLVRFLQCLRRLWDTGLWMNILNAGKYSAAIIYSLCYHYWGHLGCPRKGPFFVLFCFTACLNALYSCAWDLFVDWSLFKRRSRYPLLRPDLIYTSRIASYYFAIVSNILLRFIWVIYLPSRGPDFTLRSVFAAMMEILRRIQWNFYRVENEHLGNVDQYRVTREVPLPYTLDSLPDMYYADDDDDDDDDDEGGI